MQQPVSIAPLLWCHQAASKPDFTITHGKGRKGIIIRTRRPARWAQVLKAAFSGVMQ